ncbi:MAG: Ig-like domain-containing protein, partial [Lachnospiraceae bacterium]|nr:Ig-like domain-containing protein [Lachnospiraceae bacterium]
AGITGVSVTVSDFSKTEATEGSEGSIRGTITITSGNETDSVEFTKTIGKLPSSDTEKVAAAKTAVQTAIENITVSNATTREEIQNVVEAALDQAGITGVSVTVSDFSKTEATEGSEGSIRGTITITSGNETDSVEFAKTIGKLPSTTKTPGNTGNTGNTGNITEEQNAFTQKIMKEQGVSEETAIKILALAEELGLSEETLLIGESTFANHQSEDDMKGSTFSILQAAASKVTAKSVKLTWKKVKGADGYQIYASPCGKKNKLKLVKTIKKSSVKTYTQKKRKKGTAYRYVVRAYKNIDGKKITIAVSKTIHVFTGGGKYGNAKSVKVKKTQISLKKGKTFKIKASEVKKDKALKKHRAMCYESSNTKVATVTKKGKIKAKAKGKCTVYVYAQNGKMKKVKVTVK